MCLKNISNHELIQRLEKLVRTERKITHLVLLHIAEIEDRKIYAEMGYDGMYAYLTRGLGYSEGSAYRRLHSARLLKNVPAIAEKIETGALNLTQLAQVQKCLKDDLQTGKKVSAVQTERLLENLQHKNTFETQKVLAIEFNQPVKTHESLKPQSDESVRIEVTLNKEQFQELEMAKSLLSHVCPDGSWAEVIALLAKGFNKKKLGGKDRFNKSAMSNSKDAITGKDELKSGSNLGSDCQRNSKLPQPMNTLKNNSNTLKKTMHVRNTEYAIKISSRLTHNILPTEFSTRRRKYISIHDKRKLLRKANHCCEYVDPKTQKKCQSKFQLEIDHIHPIVLGGNDDIQNLRILCRTHNALAARKLGIA